jgi:hypothetical protein
VPGPAIPPAQPMTCPRCGQSSRPGAGPFCPHCGRYLAALRWVAEPPPGAAVPAAVPRPPGRYAGPPRYPEPPRWGFPAAPWRTTGTDDPPTDPLPAARAVAGTVAPLLWATAAVALVAAGAEAWRYVLLLSSREGALAAGVVAASDALVLAAGTIALVLAAVSGGLLILWTIRAARAAADRAGLSPSRSPRAVVLGWVVPGLNLSVPGSVFAEIEHAALDRSPATRPRPSRLVLTWWALWVAGVLLAGVVLAWSLRDGVQAAADAVVLHGVLDLLAAVTAGVTAVVVTRLTRLLGPFEGAAAREILVGVRPAPPDAG